MLTELYLIASASGAIFKGVVSLNCLSLSLAVAVRVL